ncbi:4597_t:CDS:2 [Scutellospora calospora]|uniref:4597_t:CDS:1 n=1 Tax=Scutellospora calospora TaxID=85575 RepID=A0ACA9M561_9GLOM|nr:4597_t:CDS:2 [Scutellospora calospora]
MTKDPDLKPIHPGEILKTEFLEPLNMSEGELAQHLKVEEKIIKELVQAKTSLTVDLAYRLYYYFGVSTEYWLNFQKNYDLETYQELAEKEIRKQIQPYPHEAKYSTRRARRKGNWNFFEARSLKFYILKTEGKQLIMSSEDNQESLLKVIQDTQKNQILMSVIGAINGMAGLGRIAKTKLRHKAELEREYLELKTLEREAAYEAQMSQYQADLTSETKKSDSESKENGKGKADKTLEGTVNKVQSGIKQAKGVADQIKDLKDKIFSAEKEK